MLIIVVIYIYIGVNQIEEAENGLEALEIVIKHHQDKNDFHFIITDNQMPVMDGVTSVVKMREIGFHNTIVMITGDCLVQDRNIMINAGVDYVLLKPLQKDKMFALLNL